jgi:iron complex transport system permease protein
VAALGLAAAAPRRIAPATALIVLGGLLLLAFLLSLGLGPVPLTPHEIAAALMNSAGLDSMTRDIVLALRLPRSLCAIVVGGILAASGAAMQGLFRNPLADPTLIGVSGGAALAAAAFIVFGGLLAVVPEALRFYATPLAAFLGGMAVVLLIQRLAQRDGRTEVATMLLAGIAINAVVMAGIGLLSFIGTDAQLRSISFWSLGSLGGSGWTPLLAMLPMIALAFAACLWAARVLDAMMLGEREAQMLGYRIEAAKRLLVIAVAAGVGAAVAFTGLIAFVGIVAPHMIRLALGPSHRLLLPASAMLGAILLLLADTLCRLVVAPAELPIGILTSLLGGPFFLVLLFRQERAA